MSRCHSQCLPSPRDISPRLQQRLNETPSSQWCTGLPWMVGLTDKVMSPEWPDSTGASETSSPLMATSSPRVKQVVIPPSCRDSIMADLHGSHASIIKAMDLARTCVLLAWHGSRCHWLHQAVPNMHQKQQPYQWKCFTPTRSLLDLE